jgi:hypothetical protein
MSNNNAKSKYMAVKVRREDWRTLKTVSAWKDVDMADLFHELMVHYVLPELQAVAVEIQGTTPTTPQADGKSPPRRINPDLWRPDQP